MKSSCNLLQQSLKKCHIYPANKQHIANTSTFHRIANMRILFSLDHVCSDVCLSLSVCPIFSPQPFRMVLQWVPGSHHSYTCVRRLTLYLTHVKANRWPLCVLSAGWAVTTGGRAHAVCSGRHRRRRCAIAWAGSYHEEAVARCWCSGVFQPIARIPA